MQAIEFFSEGVQISNANEDSDIQMFDMPDEEFVTPVNSTPQMADQEIASNPQLEIDMTMLEAVEDEQQDQTQATNYIESRHLQHDNSSDYFSDSGLASTNLDQDHTAGSRKYQAINKGCSKQVVPACFKKSESSTLNQ